jgi:hypothetical protein
MRHSVLVLVHPARIHEVTAPATKRANRSAPIRCREQRRSHCPNSRSGTRWPARPHPCFNQRSYIVVGGDESVLKQLFVVI